MLNENKIEMLKKRYPQGTTVMLDYMDDPYHPVPVGMIGTVLCVDDMGTIHVKWNNGSSLGVCIEVDRIHVVKESHGKMSIDKKEKK